MTSKHRQIPSPVLGWVSRTSEYLADLFRSARHDTSSTSWDFYKEEKEAMLTTNEVVWWTEGSERTVVFLGRTFDGDRIFDDNSGLVIKFQPSVPARDDPDSAANRKALRTYAEIVERGDQSLIAPVFAAAADGSWLAQKYVTPISPPRNDSGAPYDRIRDTPEKNLKADFQKRCSEAGLDVNCSRGNIGLDKDGEVVLIDIGGHTSYYSSPTDIQYPA